MSEISELQTVQDYHAKTMHELLTALQRLIARIEVLEAKVASLQVATFPEAEVPSATDTL